MQLMGRPVSVLCAQKSALCMMGPMRERERERADFCPFSQGKPGAKSPPPPPLSTTHTHAQRGRGGAGRRIWSSPAPPLFKRLLLCCPTDAPDRRPQSSPSLSPDRYIMATEDIHAAYGALLFRLDDITDTMTGPHPDPGSPPDVGGKADRKRAELLAETAYNQYREKAKRFQRERRTPLEEIKDCNRSARQAIDSFLRALCGGGGAGEKRAAPTSAAGDGDRTVDDESKNKRARLLARSISTSSFQHEVSCVQQEEDQRLAETILQEVNTHVTGDGGPGGRAGEEHVLSGGQRSSAVDLYATAVGGRPVTRCVVVDIGARGGGRAVALLRQWRARCRTQSQGDPGPAPPRFFGVLVEYSSMAAAAAVDLAFDNGLICIYVMCPGMIRDQHSADTVARAEQHNRTLRTQTEGGRAIRGEVCIYQGDVRNNLASIRDTLSVICRDGAGEGGEKGGATVGLVTCHAAMHSLLSKALDPTELQEFLRDLVRPFACWSMHCLEPSMPSGPCWARGGKVHIRVPGWTALQLEELCGLLVDALPGLAASGSAVVPLAEMDAVAGLSPGCTGGYSGTGHVVVHPSVFLSTAQRLIERTLDAPVVPAVLGSPPHKMTRRSSAPPPASPPHQSMGHYSNAGDGADPPHVLRVDTVLGMEMLYHVMFDVWDPRHMDAFRDSLSWVLRGDQLTIVDPVQLARLLSALGTDVRVVHSHFMAPSCRDLWVRLRPTVYSQTGAPVLFDVEGGLEPLDPSVVVLACGGY